MIIVINSFLYTLTFTCALFSCIICKNVDSEGSLNLRNYLIEDANKGTRAVDYFYDVDDLEESVKKRIIESVSQVLKDNKILEENDDDTPVIMKIQNPIKTGEINVGVFELSKEPVSLYTENASKQRIESDENEYFPSKSEDGTNVLCEDWKKIALEKQRLKPSVFVPKCNPDGSYVSEQCDDVAGFCWCVNEHGEEIGGTLVKFENAKCDKKRNKKGIEILASGQSLIDIGIPSEELEYFKCEKEKRSLERLKTYLNGTIQRLRIPVCENDDYAPVQCLSSKKFCWCVGRNGEVISRTGKLGKKPTNCATHRENEKENVDVSYGWTYLWKVMSEWLSEVRIMTLEAREENPNYVYKPSGVLVKLPPNTGFKKSMIFLPQESPDNDTMTPYNVWLKIMKCENPDFDAHSYEIDNKEIDKYQSIEVPDGEGNYYLITVSDFLRTYPKLEDLWQKVKRNASEFEERIKDQQMLDWKKLSEQPKSEASDPIGILAAGTFQMRSERKVCFCYNKRYWQKLHRFIEKNRTNSVSDEAKIHGRSMKKGSRSNSEESSSSGCKTVCNHVRHPETDYNIALLEGLTVQDVLESASNSKAKEKVDKAIKKQISKINPMRSLLEMSIENFEKLSGIEFNNILIPMRYYSPEFWYKLSDYTNEPLASIEKKLELDFNLVEAIEQSKVKKSSLEQERLEQSRPEKSPTRAKKRPAINFGRLIRFMSQSNLNTKQLLLLAGYSTKLMLGGLENTIFIAISGSLKAISIPYNFITGYLSESRPVTKVTDTVVNSEPSGIPGTVTLRTGICNFGVSMVSFVKSVPDYVKDVQIYFGDLQKCTRNCPTFSNDLAISIKQMAVWSYATSFAMKINYGARIYREIPFYLRLYLRKSLRRAGFSFLLASEAHFEMLFQTVAMLGIGFVKPFLKVPYIVLLGDGSIVERALGTFPAVIELTGDFIKPLVVITEPFLRGGIFLLTGDWHLSMNAGRGHSEYYDRNVLTPFDGRPALLEDYKPYTVRRGQIMGPDGVPIDVETPNEDDEDYEPPPTQFMLESPDSMHKVVTDPNADSMHPVQTTVDPESVETSFLDNYQGITPVKGYTVDYNRFPVLREEPHIKVGLLSRTLQLPFFLLVAGGPLFGPLSNLVTPIINMTTLFLYSGLHIYEKVRQVPEILDSSSEFYRPVTTLLNGFLPVTDLLYDFWSGKASAIQTTARAPVAFMTLATSPLKFMIYAPTAAFKEARNFWAGANGIISMFTLQFSEKFISYKRGYIFRRAHEGYLKAKYFASQNPEHDNLLFVTSYMGLYYIKPHLDVISSVFNGGIGNIIDPNKAYKYELFCWTCDPYNSMVKLSQNQAAMYEVAADPNMYVQSILGGEDPDDIKVVGIDASRLVRGNVDPVKLMLGGKNLLPVTQQSELFNEKPSETELDKIGINVTNLEKIGLSYEQLMSNGLWDAKQDVLLEYGIDPFLLVNRMMRNSIVDKKAFLACGISVKKMLSKGIRPDYFIAAGVSAVSAKTWKRLNINPTHTSDALAFFKIGISFDILKSLSMDPVKFVEKGIAGFSDSVVRTVLGINKQKLLKSVYLGFSETSLYKMGVHAKKLIRSGYSPVVLVTGSPQLSKMNDEQLQQIGINVQVMRTSDLKPRSLLQHGIMSTDLYKFNKLGVNPDEMLTQLYSKSGVGALADNEYGEEDNVYAMSSAAVNIAKGNNLPELNDLYYFLTKENRSVFVIAKEKAYNYLGYTGGGFLSWSLWNLIMFTFSFLNWLLYLPFKIFNFFHIIATMFSLAFALLGEAMF